MAWTLTNTIFSGIHVIKPGDLCADEQPLLNLSALKHQELVSVSLLAGLDRKWKLLQRTAMARRPFWQGHKSPELRVCERR